METQSVTAQIRAVVTKVVQNQGFVVTFPEEDSSLIGRNDSITFSLSVWGGSSPPQQGQSVILSEVQRFSKGWRASKASPVLFQK